MLDDEPYPRIVKAGCFVESFGRGAEIFSSGDRIKAYDKEEKMGERGDFLQWLRVEASQRLFMNVLP